MIDRTCFTHMLAAWGFLAALLAAGRLEAQAPPASPPPSLLQRLFPSAKPSDPKPAAGPTASGQPARGGREPDLAYGAYHRGYFLTAFAEATRPADEKGDPPPRRLPTELY